MKQKILKRMRIKKLRKRLLNKSWLNNKLINLLNESENLEHFYKFKCSDFFVGEQKAAYNRKIYYSSIKRNNRQINFINFLLK